MAEIRGYRIDLPGERSVFVGRRMATDFSKENGIYYVQFKNGATVSRFRITAEAITALQKLLSGDETQPPVCARSQSFEIDEKPGDSGHWRWQTVKEKDA